MCDFALTFARNRRLSLVSQSQHASPSTHSRDKTSLGVRLQEISALDESYRFMGMDDTHEPHAVHQFMAP